MIDVLLDPTLQILGDGLTQLDVGLDGGEVAVDGDAMVVNGDRIRVLAERNPADLPWGDLGVAWCVLHTPERPSSGERTGFFRSSRPYEFSLRWRAIGLVQPS